MEQQQRSLVFTAAVGLIILAIIVGSIYYLVKFIQSRVASSRQSPQPSVEQLVQASPTAQVEGVQEGQQAQPNQPAQTAPTQPAQGGNPSPAPAQARPSPSANRPSPTSQGETKGGISTSADKKTYNGGSFQLSYPKNWGTLTCSNSDNIELDPLSATDSKVNCNYSVKPVTILVSDNTGCVGETVKLGETTVVKSRASQGGYTKYQWCTRTTPTLNITHRVSTEGDPAASREDFSKQIEEMISKLTFTRSS